MKSQQEIERLTEQTLNSIDNLQQLDANDFLYSKIVSRMQMREQEQRGGYRRLMLRLSFALVLFSGINVASFFAFQHQQNRPAKPSKSAAAAFAEEYSLSGDNYNY